MVKVIGERIYQNIGLISGRNKLFFGKKFLAFIIRADFFVVIDNINLWFYSKTDKGYIWEYTFTMAVDKATLEFKAEGGI